MRGDGTLYRRKNAKGEETGPFWAQFFVNGRRYRESTGTENETEAGRWLRQRTGDVARGLPVAPRYDKLRFDEALTDMENDYRNNGKRSLDALQRRARLHLTPFFGRRRMIGITTADVRAYVAHRKDQKATNATINRELAVLKRMFTLAVQANRLPQKPHIPMLKEDNTRTGFFSPVQIASILSHLPEDVSPVVEFAAETGWRVASEVLPLQWRQVDFVAGEVRLDPGTTKNGEGRAFPMTAALRRLLEAQRARTEALKHERGRIVPFVFHRNGEPVRNFRKAFASACKAAGCPGRLLHDLRRTAVRRMVRAGVTPQVVMGLVGHKTASMLWRYNITAADDLTDAARKLDADANSHSSATNQQASVTNA